MPVITHTHQFKRLKNKKYMCADPHCTHVREKYELVGKASLCNNCRAEFILDRHALRVSKPLCMKCRNTKDAVTVRRLTMELENLFSKEEKPPNALSQ